MTRSEKILETITAFTRQLHMNHLEQHLQNLKIESLSQITGISANNISMEVNRLFRAGKLVKICGRPVFYLTPAELEHFAGRQLASNEFENMDLFMKFIFSNTKTVTQPVFIKEQGDLNPLATSDIEQLIGYNRSLSRQIFQGKAAVLYPPNGLHMLITGPTGVGKSHFARAIYDFAVKSHKLKPNAALITLNCASYAENPQLLLSQLFGYTKGAYTGASKDHPGMVEYADGGILFLDEIHRLNPEGQEKMFHLMDHGTFSRLGETDRERHVNVLIIGATTSQPDEIMLDTFQRRIPVQIALPPLKERSLEERLEMVLFFLWKEARNLKKRIYIDFMILCALCYYECKANIGQLSSDIKLACADAYFDFLTGKEKFITLQSHHLHKRVMHGLFVSSNSGNSLMKEIVTSTDTFVIDGNYDFESIISKYVNETPVL